MWLYFLTVCSVTDSDSDSDIKRTPLWSTNLISANQWKINNNVYMYNKKIANDMHQK